MEVIEEQIPKFIQEFRDNYTELKRGLQLGRGRITYVSRITVVNFLKFHKIPRNAEQFMKAEEIEAMRQRYSEECKNFWKKNWDGE
jgi:hypothetical protein